MKKTILVLILLLASSSTSWGLPNTYAAGPTWGTVIDAETKQPISGAVVVALWDLEGGMERSQIATLQVAEAMTDESGSFRISGWGPLPRPSKGILDAYDPQLIIFKPGYVPERLLNDKFLPLGKRANLEIHDSVWNGKAIGLKEYKGPLNKDYSLRVAFIEGSLSWVLYGEDCAWKRIPKTIRALEEESAREIAAGTNPTFSAPLAILMAIKRCAPTDAFEKAYRENR